MIGKTEERNKNRTAPGRKYESWKALTFRPGTFHPMQYSILLFIKVLARVRRVIAPN